MAKNEEAKEEAGGGLILLPKFARGRPGVSEAVVAPASA